MRMMNLFSGTDRSHALILYSHH